MVSLNLIYPIIRFFVSKGIGDVFLITVYSYTDSYGVMLDMKPDLITKSYINSHVS